MDKITLKEAFKAGKLKMTTLSREDIIEKQTTAVYQMALRKHNIVLEADFLEDLLQTALDVFIEALPNPREELTAKEMYEMRATEVMAHKGAAEYYRQLLILRRELRK